MIDIIPNTQYTIHNTRYTLVYALQWSIVLPFPVYIYIILYLHNIITCSQYSQESPPFQDAHFPTTSEGLQSVCKLSFRVFNR